MRSSVSPQNIDDDIEPYRSDEEDSETLLNSSSDASNYNPRKYSPGEIIVVPLRDVELPNPIESDQDTLAITILQRVGKGFGGTVYKVSDNMNDKISALKVFNRPLLTSPHDCDSDVNRKEINFLRRIDHPHITSFRATCPITMNPFLMTEFCEYGSLEEFTEERRMFSEIEGKVLFVQLLSAVHYLHSHEISHEDLHAGNILIANTADSMGICLKLADFGLAYGRQHDGESHFYLDEGLLRRGCVRDMRSISYFFDIAIGRRLVDGPFWWSEELVDLYTAVLALDKNEQYFTFEEYVNHPWLALSVPFPKRIPVSAIDQVPEFTDISDELSNLYRMETFKELGLHELRADRSSG